jgi:hypothetical protein
MTEDDPFDERCSKVAPIWEVFTNTMVANVVGASLEILDDSAD